MSPARVPEERRPLPLPGTQTAELRPIRASDREGLIAVVAAAYDEYPGCVLDLPGVDADLDAPASSDTAVDGGWWVVDADGVVIGSVAAGSLRADGHLELKRLYVAASHRGRGLATTLVRHVEAVATEAGASAVDLWSDTRFADAHRLYARLGYRRTGERRHLDDPSDTTEWRFRRPL